MKDFYEMDFSNIYKEPESYDLARAFLNRLWRKLHVFNFSLLILFYGKHRVGKSLAAVTFAYLLDETFEKELEQRVVYGSRDFLAAMKSLRNRNIKGGGVIFDEAGSSELASQRWYEDAAKVISSNLQACGYLNPFIGFVTQNFSFVNTQARKLSQGVFEVDRVTNQCSRIKPFWIENNPWTSKFYRRYPIFCERRNGIPSNVYKLGMIKIGLPPKDILERYINHSQAFKDKLLDDSARDIDILDTQKQMQNAYVTDLNDIVDLVKKDLETYKTSSRHDRLDEDLIRHKFRLKHRDAKVVKLLAEKSIKASSRQTHTQKSNDAI
jgi:hypothetical protein